MEQWCKLDKDNCIMYLVDYDPNVFLAGSPVVREFVPYVDGAQPGMYIIGGILLAESLVPTPEEVAKAEREIETLNLLIELGVII